MTHALGPSAWLAWLLLIGCRPTDVVTDSGVTECASPRVDGDVSHVAVHVSSVLVPSGIAAELSFPSTASGARYQDVCASTAAEPVVVVVQGGTSRGSMIPGDLPSFADYGFVSLTFQFPVADERGPASQQALEEVIAFAGGDGFTTDGLTVRQLAPLVSTDDLGKIGRAHV